MNNLVINAGHAGCSAASHSADFCPPTVILAFVILLFICGCALQPELTGVGVSLEKYRNFFWHQKYTDSVTVRDMEGQVDEVTHGHRGNFRNVEDATI